MRDQIARDKIKDLIGDFQYERGLRNNIKEDIFIRLDILEDKLSALIDYLGVEWHETKIEKGFKKKRGSK